jgi:hypothetical protein
MLIRSPHFYFSKTPKTYETPPFSLWMELISFFGRADPLGGVIYVSGFSHSGSVSGLADLVGGI